MFDFVFYIDTSDSKHICYHQMTYGVRERKIMNKHIQILEDNDCVFD